MKNHWLKIHDDKKKKFWTVSFSNYGVYTLKPRRAEIVDSVHSLGFMGAVSGRVEINFKDGMVNAKDMEFVDFLFKCKKSMRHWIGCFRFYVSIIDELEYYEVGDMSYQGVGVGVRSADIAVHIAYNKLNHVHCV